MQQPMPVTPQVLTLNPLKGAAKVDEIDYSADFDNLFSKMEDFDKFFKTVKISYNMLKYMPGLAKAAYQGQLKSTERKRKYGDDSYKGKKIIKFNIQLAANQYTNFDNAHICFRIKIKSAADNDNDILAGVIPVNNFFAHWIKETNIKRYGKDMPILPLTNTVDIYRYSDEMLKHMSNDALKTLKNHLLFSKEKVKIYGNDNDVRSHRTTTNATHLQRTGGIAKFNR